MKLMLRWMYPSLVCLCLLIFGLHYLVTKQAVYGDGIGYYAHLHSWYFDGDWNYTNEYQHIYSPSNNNSFYPQTSQTIQIVAQTDDGRAENHYNPGVAVLLLPFYILADILVTALSVLGISLAQNGYSDPYQIGVGVAAIFYFVTGLWLVEAILKKYVQDEVITKLSVLTLFGATSLLYYGSFDVINSHFASFFLSAMFVYQLKVQADYKHKRFVLGLLVGLATSVRFQDSLLVVIWFVDWWLSTDKKYGMSLIKDFLAEVKYLVAGAVLGSWTMLYHWVVTFGNPLHHTYIRNLFIEWNNDIPLSPLGSLFHPVTGLFFRTPLLMFLFFFLVYELFKKNVRPYTSLVVFFCLQYVVITIQGGWYAAAYGGRMYISSLLLFALLLGAFLKWIKKKFSYAGVGLICGVFVLINLFSMTHFIVVEKGIDDSHTTTKRELLDFISTSLLHFKE